QDTPQPMLCPLFLHDALPIFAVVAVRRRTRSLYFARSSGAAATAARAAAMRVAFGTGVSAVIVALRTHMRFMKWPPPKRSRPTEDRKSTRLNSSHRTISYAVL